MTKQESVTDRLQLDVYARTASGTEHSRCSANGGRVNVRLGGSISFLLAHLRMEDGEILDEIDTGQQSIFEPDHGDSRIRHSARELRLEIESLILAGEGPHAEFKRALSDRDNYREFVETVCAFVKSKGGVILLGVADDGEVIGCDPRKPSNDHIVKVLAERCDPYPPVSVERVDLKAPITVIRVNQAPVRPCLMGGVALYRAGSTDRRMGHAELVGLTAQQLRLHYP